jgi:FKBP-type peptidyl-prolyl cis-trans isomerase FkpA
MSVSETANSPAKRGRSAKLFIGLIAVIAAGIGLAWLSASPFRGETTPTGVRIRTLTEGSGAYIQPMDGVMVDYEGRLADGTVFDSSASHGGPQPMIAGQVIPGFAEALGKMQKGGSYKIHIPGAQAYGANPPPGSPFGPNADLDFDVKIVNVVPNAALMAGAQGPAGAEAPQGQPGAEPQLPAQGAPQP